MHESVDGMTQDVADAIKEDAYRSHYPMTHEEYLKEPAHVVETALLIWAKKAERDKLDREKAAASEQ